MKAIQIDLFSEEIPTRRPPKQLLKWVGNKHRYAPQIAQTLPQKFNTYIEPFVGTGAVLGAVAPRRGIAGDILKPLIEIWLLVQDNPTALLEYYDKTWHAYIKNPSEIYQEIKESYNNNPNPLDLLFISRSCYGGVLRFTREHTISTPVGPHRPISPQSFKARLTAWRERVRHTRFAHADFRETMAEAESGDVVYCDPPYIYSQSILYGAQAFNIRDLWEAIERCVSVGAKVALSLDGHKKSGKLRLHINIPDGLFKQTIMIDCGRSMLRRFQKSGETMDGEDVNDRLLLTW